MQPHPEHQEDHPQLGKLGRKAHVRHIARRERPDHDPGQKIPGDQRQLQPLRQKAEQEGKAEACNQRGDQGRLVGQCVMVLSGPIPDREGGHSGRGCLSEDSAILGICLPMSNAVAAEFRTNPAYPETCRNVTPVRCLI